LLLLCVRMILLLSIHYCLVGSLCLLGSMWGNLDDPLKFQLVSKFGADVSEV
jgi:hypothetical protein